MFSSLVVLVGFLIKISNGTAPKIRRTLHLSYRQANSKPLSAKN
jgi:hypothetical protein